MVTTKGYTDRIKALGYEATQVEIEPRGGQETPKGLPGKLVLPDSAPAFLVDAVERAKKSGKPLILDFWATWCGPCKRLKQETLKDREVARMLESAVLVFVDVDEHPKLASALGVRTVPDVFLVDRNGNIVSRLRNFESADKFAARLKRLLDQR